MHFNLIVREGTSMTDDLTPVIEQEPNRDFRVLQPIFKHGRLYEPGELISLEPSTAERFIALGEIEEVE